VTGCTATEPEQRVEAQVQAIEEEPASCTIEDSPPSVTLALPDGIADGDLEVATDGTLPITIENASDEAASASVRIRSRSEAGWRATTLDAGRVAARGSIEVEIAAASLALPRGPFEYSGSITLIADLALDGGDSAQSLAVHAFFHPIQAGWLVYDRAGRTSRHDDGALTESARSDRAELAARFGAGGSAVGSSPVRHVSDSARFVPDNDVPVDPDQAQ